MGDGVESSRAVEGGSHGELVPWTIVGERKGCLGKKEGGGCWGEKVTCAKAKRTRVPCIQTRGGVGRWEENEPVVSRGGS